MSRRPAHLAVVLTLAAAPGCVIGVGHPVGYPPAGAGCGAAVGCADTCGPGGCGPGPLHDTLPPPIPEAVGPGRFFPVPTRPAFSPGPAPPAAAMNDLPSSGQGAGSGGSPGSAAEVVPIPAEAESP